MSSSDEIDLDAKVPGAAAGIGGPDGPDAVARAAGVEAQTAASAVELEANRAIAEDLASGALDPVAAQQLIIDQVIAEQLPADAAPEQIERLRLELTAMLEGDPTLAGLLRP